jgi:PAS domain S-box-containing protein
MTGQQGDDDPKQAIVVLGLLEESASDVAILCSTEGMLLYVSAAIGRMLGWEPAELTGRMVGDFIHPQDRETARIGLAAAVRTTETVVTTQRHLARDGGFLWTECATRQVVDLQQGNGVALITSMRDIADRKLVEARLERQALTDPLTGIANRTVLMDRLTQALSRLQRDKNVLAVIYLDLDRFKVINDSLGHKLGDQLLFKVAERALKSLRPADTLARIGGDEFVVVAEGLHTVDDAKRPGRTDLRQHRGALRPRRRDRRVRRQRRHRHHTGFDPHRPGPPAGGRPGPLPCQGPGPQPG